MNLEHVPQFFLEVSEIAQKINYGTIEKVVSLLNALKACNGRLFLIGVGGSAANCSHAVNDFRKICGIEAYTPVDNVSELTARTNDDGWESVFSEWLKISRMTSNDMLFIFSVGGGDREKGISINIINAIDEAKKRGAVVLGIVGKDSGYTAQHGDAVIVIPSVESGRVTPHSEAFQAVVWHCLVSDPRLQVKMAKWESITMCENLVV
jgi:D-sedoheptulose 7-phosphate isomerase